MPIYDLRREHTCLKTQTVNSIPNCFNLEVVPLPTGIETQEKHIELANNIWK